MNEIYEDFLPYLSPYLSRYEIMKPKANADLPVEKLPPAIPGVRVGESAAPRTWPLPEATQVRMGWSRNFMTYF